MAPIAYLVKSKFPSLVLKIFHSLAAFHLTNSLSTRQSELPSWNILTLKNILRLLMTSDEFQIPHISFLLFGPCLVFSGISSSIVFSLQSTSQVVFPRYFLYSSVFVSLYCSNRSWTTCNALSHICFKSQQFQYKRHPIHQAFSIFSTLMENQSPFGASCLGPHALLIFPTACHNTLSFHDSYLCKYCSMSISIHTSFKTRSLDPTSIVPFYCFPF